MRKILACFLSLLFCFIVPPKLQAQNSQTYFVSSSGAFPGIDERTQFVTYHKVVWNTGASAPATCQLQLEGSPDNSNWSTIFPSTLCTSNGSVSASGVFNFVRLNVTAISGGSINVCLREGPGNSCGDAIGGGPGITGSPSGQPVNNAVWITPADTFFANLTSNAITSSTSFAYDLSLRIQGSDGAITTLSTSATVTCSAGLECNTVPFISPGKFGWLVMARSGQSNGGAAYGEIWDQLMMGCANLGLTGSGTIPVATFGTCTPGPMVITQGYVSGFESICYGTGISCPVAVPSNQMFNSNAPVGNPAAGTDWSAVIGTGIRSCLQGVFAKLVTSAGVANRQVTLQINAGSTTIYLYPSSIIQTASQTNFYSWAPGAVNTSAPQTAAATNFVSVPYYNGGNTGVCFNAGDATVTILSVTANIQAADQWSLITLRFGTTAENN